MVENEYAKALFDLAVEEKKIDKYLEYLDSLTKILNEEKDFLKLLDSPLIDLDEKLKMVNEIFKCFDGVFLSFLKLLIRNNRLKNIKVIKDGYNDLFEEYKGVLKVEIISSEKLTKERINSLTKLLKDRYPNKKLIIENTVNSNILYGIQIICNGQSLDMSLNNMLNKIKESL